LTPPSVFFWLSGSQWSLKENRKAKRLVTDFTRHFAFHCAYLTSFTGISVAK